MRTIGAHVGTAPAQVKGPARYDTHTEPANISGRGIPQPGMPSRSAHFERSPLMGLFATMVGRGRVGHRNSRDIALCLTLLLALVRTEVLSQCAIPAVGCSGLDLTDYGFTSGNNAAAIEYDNFVSSYHSTVVRTSDGTFKVWGEDMASNGTTDVLSPQEINSSNYPALTGTPLKVGLGSQNGNTTQGILLSTTGLFAWSTSGNVISTTIKNTTAFGPITVGGNANGLPTGVSPADVKMLFVTRQSIALTTCGGSVYVLSQRANINQGVSSTSWVQVRTNEAGNPFLANVVATRGCYGALVSLRSDGTLWTWGESTYLGNNTAASALNRASQMTLPPGITVKMFGATHNDSGTAVAYYVLATDGNLYA